MSRSAQVVARPAQCCARHWSMLWLIGTAVTRPLHGATVTRPLHDALGVHGPRQPAGRLARPPAEFESFSLRRLWQARRFALVVWRLTLNDIHQIFTPRTQAAANLLYALRFKPSRPHLECIGLPLPSLACRTAARTMTCACAHVHVHAHASCADVHTELYRCMSCTFTLL
jgi:hypothetical protein